MLQRRTFGDRLITGVAMIFAPPFAFVTGIIGAFVLWNVLEGAGLPEWGRIGLALLAIPAVPGLWFVLLPIAFSMHRPTRLELPPEAEVFRERQVEVMARHHETFEQLRRQAIERVIPIRQTMATDGVSVTLVALELGPVGGGITVLHRLDDLPAEGTDPSEVPMPTSLDMSVVELSDDVGTEYAILAGAGDVSATAGRGHFAFIPAPPDGAGALHLSVRHLVMIGPSPSLPGPWEFDVGLRDR